jgi:hypothetical protein
LVKFLDLVSISLAVAEEGQASGVMKEPLTSEDSEVEVMEATPLQVRTVRQILAAAVVAAIKLTSAATVVPVL